MAKTDKKGLARVMYELKWILAIYLCFVVVVYFAQSYLIYHPVGKLGTPAGKNLPEMTEITIDTHDGLDLAAWFAKPSKDKDKVVVFFHGNAGNASGRQPKIKEFLNKGYGFLMVEYRGYGGNPGKPNEIDNKKDAQAAIRYLKEQGYNQNDLVLYGESLGTGIATYIASETAPAAVILEAPYTSLLDVAKKSYWFFPVSLMLKEKYPSLELMGKIKSPILIVQGEEDNIIPVEMGKQMLAAANSNKKGVFIPEAGHNNLHHHGSLQHMTKWLDANLPANDSKKVTAAYIPDRFNRRRNRRLK
jgi:fermentation-respiration switch protein FrsA (DUF1100 family)